MIKITKEQIAARRRKLDQAINRVQDEVITAEKALKHTEHEIAKLDRAIRFQKLIMIGEIFKKADLLDSYDPDKLLNLLMNERKNLIK